MDFGATEPEFKPSFMLSSYVILDKFLKMG